MDRHVRDRNGDKGQEGDLAVALAFQEKLTLSLPACRFPNLFPPLKPETVARRTVEAVQLNQALLLLPWTMHALIILKRYRAVGGSSESGSCGPCPLLPGDLGDEEASNKRKNPHDRLVMSAVGVKMRVVAYRSWSYYLSYRLPRWHWW